MEKYKIHVILQIYLTQIIANWNFEQKLLSEYLSMGATEIGVLESPRNITLMIWMSQYLSIM